MVEVYRARSDTAAADVAGEKADEGAVWGDDSFGEPERNAPLRLTLSAVIGLAIVGIGLTAAATVVRSLGATESLPVAEDSAPVVEVGSEQVASPGAEKPVLIVHVVGEVYSPGIVQLEHGSRVVDAIDAAGGVTEHAHLTGLNLARPVSDGEQIVVPLIPPDGSDLGAGTDVAIGQQPGLISLSRADRLQLESLPGIGPALAERIIAWRDANGPFLEVSDVLAVSGIGVSTLDGFAHLVVP